MIRFHVRSLAALVLVPVLAAPVPGAGSPVDPQSIREAIRQEWVARAPAGASLEIRALPSLPADDTDLRVDVLLPDDLMRPGPRAVPVSLRRGDRIVARGLANILIRREVAVWVAEQALQAGEELHAEDLRAETRVYDREPTRLFAFDPAETWRLSRDVEAGAQLRSVDVDRVADIEAGKEILLIARAGNASVSVTGRARQSGDVGKTILVHNPMTGALVRAVVRDSGSAELIQAGDTSAGETQ